MGSRQTKKELVKETEAFLSGRYGEYLDTRNRIVPDWVWLGVLAHGSFEQLRALAVSTHTARSKRTALRWQAVAFLAAEIVSQIDNDRGLDELRRAVLLPLEISWRPEAGHTANDPAQFVRMVLDALDQHQRSTR